MQQPDFVELEVLARCYATRLPVPELFYVNSENLSPTVYLEGLARTGNVACPDAVLKHVTFANAPVSVATIATALLGRLRQTGQLPDPAQNLPVVVTAPDALDALAQLAIGYRAERPAPREIRVAGKCVSTTEFLDGLRYDRRECPAAISTHIGMMAYPSTVAEVSSTLLGRLRQAGSL